jgi:hypothetical protein
VRCAASRRRRRLQRELICPGEERRSRERACRSSLLPLVYTYRRTRGRARSRDADPV